MMKRALSDTCEPLHGIRHLNFGYDFGLNGLDGTHFVCIVFQKVSPLGSEVNQLLRMAQRSTDYREPLQGSAKGFLEEEPLKIKENTGALDKLVGRVDRQNLPDPAEKPNFASLLASQNMAGLPLSQAQAHNPPPPPYDTSGLPCPRDSCPLAGPAGKSCPGNHEDDRG